MLRRKFEEIPKDHLQTDARRRPQTSIFQRNSGNLITLPLSKWIKNTSFRSGMLTAAVTSAGRPNRAAPERGSHSQRTRRAPRDKKPMSCDDHRSELVRVSYGSDLWCVSVESGSAARGSWDGEEGMGQVD